MTGRRWAISPVAIWWPPGGCWPWSTTDGPPTPSTTTRSMSPSWITSPTPTCPPGTGRTFSCSAPAGPTPWKANPPRRTMSRWRTTYPWPGTRPSWPPWRALCRRLSPPCCPTWSPMWADGWWSLPPCPWGRPRRSLPTLTTGLSLRTPAGGPPGRPASTICMTIQSPWTPGPTAAGCRSSGSSWWPTMKISASSTTPL